MSATLDRLQLHDSPPGPKFAGILGSAMDDKVIVDLLGQVGNLFTSSLELKETIDFMLKAAADLVDCLPGRHRLDLEGLRLEGILIEGGTAS